MHYLSHANEPTGFHHMWGGGGVYMILWFLFWAILVTLAVYGFMRWAGTEKDEEESPLAIAKKRLAKGEITEKEYKKIETELKKDDDSR